MCASAASTPALQRIARCIGSHGEDENNRRMRQMSYVNLGRFVQTLLDRKDRMSMAVRLEVRVPFCDHRLAECAFNIPWEMKPLDGREKSILRTTTRDLLPDNIAERVKSPFAAWGAVGWVLQVPQNKELISARERLGDGNLAVALNESALYLGSAIGAALDGVLLLQQWPAGALASSAGAVAVVGVLVQWLNLRRPPVALRSRVNSR